MKLLSELLIFHAQRHFFESPAHRQPQLVVRERLWHVIIGTT
ncbi:MAG: hypothetical protein ACD_39C01189G0001, partial [uncultured bacterium]